MRIRKFKETDASEVCEIILKCDSEITSKDYSKKLIELLGKNITPKKIIEDSENAVSFVAVLREKVVGHIQFSDGEIKKLHVSPDFHNKGIGKKLIDHVENNFGKSMIVKSTIFAENFYEKQGFVKRDFVFEDVEGQKFKLILMEKKLR